MKRARALSSIAGWSIWTLCGITATLLTRNPLYLGIIALTACFVYLSPDKGLLPPRFGRSMLPLGLVLWAIAVPFTMLTLHRGESILHVLPDDWFLIGGAITRESARYGLVTGLALWTQVLVLAAGVRCTHAPLLWLLIPSPPRRLASLLATASAWVRRAQGDIKGVLSDHQARRGAMWQWHDVWPRIGSAMAGSWKRAAQTTAAHRGHGSPETWGRANSADSHMARSRFSEGLVVQLGGAVALVRWETSPWVGQALVITGVVLLALALVALAHAMPLSSARSRISSHVIAISGALALAMMLFVRAVDTVALRYSPYLPAPTMAPEFNAWIGVPLALFSVPGFIRLFAEAGREQAKSHPRQTPSSDHQQ